MKHQLQDTGNGVAHGAVSAILRLCLFQSSTHDALLTGPHTSAQKPPARSYSQ